MIYERALKIKNELIKIRRELHQMPELEFDVFKTAEYIEKKLDELEIQHKRAAKTGIVAQIGKTDTKKTLLLRADVDALPITELNETEYKSKNNGMMHACGHDAHTACLLGACRILKENEDKLDGCVKFVFQPAEEGDGGAKPMIDDGIMTAPEVTAAAALHVEPLASVGTLQLRNGAIMASPDEFTIVIDGVGGHGACPEDCNNPILPSAELVKKLEGVVSDNFRDKSECVVSVCAVNAGNTHNVIPASVEIMGTVRSLSEEIRNRAEKLIDLYAKEVCNKYKCTYQYDFKRLYPPLINDIGMNNLVVKSARKISGFDKTVFLERSSMTGDDFSYFSKLVPSSYFKLGVGNSKICHPLHSPYFDIDENALPLGAAILSQIAFDYLNGD